MADSPISGLPVTGVVDGNEKFAVCNPDTGATEQVSLDNLIAYIGTQIGGAGTTSSLVDNLDGTYTHDDGLGNLTVIDLATINWANVDWNAFMLNIDWSVTDWASFFANIDWSLTDWADFFLNIDWSQVNWVDFFANIDWTQNDWTDFFLDIEWTQMTNWDDFLISVLTNWTATNWDSFIDAFISNVDPDDVINFLNQSPGINDCDAFIWNATTSTWEIKPITDCVSGGGIPIQPDNVEPYLQEGMAAFVATPNSQAVVWSTDVLNQTSQSPFNITTGQTLTVEFSPEYDMIMREWSIWSYNGNASTGSWQVREGSPTGTIIDSGTMPSFVNDGFTKVPMTVPMTGGTKYYLVIPVTTSSIPTLQYSGDTPGGRHPGIEITDVLINGSAVPGFGSRFMYFVVDYIPGRVYPSMAYVSQETFMGFYDGVGSLVPVMAPTLDSGSVSQGTYYFVSHLTDGNLNTFQIGRIIGFGDANGNVVGDKGASYPVDNTPPDPDFSITGAVEIIKANVTILENQYGSAATEPVFAKHTQTSPTAIAGIIPIGSIVI